MRFGSLGSPPSPWSGLIERLLLLPVPGLVRLALFLVQVLHRQLQEACPITQLKAVALFPTLQPCQMVLRRRRQFRYHPYLHREILR